MRKHLGVALMLTLGGCNPEPARPAAPAEAVDYAPARARMIREQIVARGIEEPRVLEAMARVPRHEFIPSGQRGEAYEDWPLPIGYGQTISQPYIVAFMTAVLDPEPGDRVLEIGTGSGYQAAVLSALVAEVYTVEIVEPLAKRAEADLKRLGYGNVKVRAGDGYLGWPEAAPFDAIIVTCAPERVPQALVEQLKEGGRMIIPVGSPWGAQELYLLRKTAAGLERRGVLPVRFVPMVKGK
jgi:protein-L-isoaspartate(D-aspartate) O-methyltransferase